MRLRAPATRVPIYASRAARGCLGSAVIRQALYKPTARSTSGVRRPRLPACVGVGLAWTCASQGAAIQPVGCSRETKRRGCEGRGRQGGESVQGAMWCITRHHTNEGGARDPGSARGPAEPSSSRWGRGHPAAVGDIRLLFCWPGWSPELPRAQPKAALAPALCGQKAAAGCVGHATKIKKNSNCCSAGT
jgi:hypothetical protein